MNFYDGFYKYSLSLICIDQNFVKQCFCKSQLYGEFRTKKKLPRETKIYKNYFFLKSQLYGEFGMENNIYQEL